MATYIKYAYLPEHGPGDGVDFVNPQDGRAPVSLASLFNGQQFFAINSRDRAFIEALDGVWQLHRIGTAGSGHDTTWNEVVVVTMDDPAEGQVLGLDEDLQITNVPPTGVDAVGLDSFSDDVFAAVKGVAIEDEGAYVRPDDFASVEFIGDDDPGDAAQDNDTWVTPAA